MDSRHWILIRQMSNRGLSSSLMNSKNANLGIGMILGIVGRIECTATSELTHLAIMGAWVWMSWWVGYCHWGPIEMVCLYDRDWIDHCWDVYFISGLCL